IKCSLTQSVEGNAGVVGETQYSVFFRKTISELPSVIQLYAPISFVLVTAAACWSHCLTTLRIVDELLVGRLKAEETCILSSPAAHLVTVISLWVPGNHWYGRELLFQFDYKKARVPPSTTTPIR